MDRKKKKKIGNFFLIILFFLALFSFFLSSVSAQMSGGRFDIYADTIGVVSGDGATGGSYELVASGGELVTASSSLAGTFEIRAGFQAMERTILGFDLTTNTLDFSSGLSIGVVATTSVVMTVNTVSPSGYSVSLLEDGNLRNGPNQIDDVVPPAVVTAGIEGYGVRTPNIDEDGLLLVDTPITGSPTGLATYAAQAFSRQTEIEFLLAIADDTPGGDYEHELTLLLTVNP